MPIFNEIEIHLYLTNLTIALYTRMYLHTAINFECSKKKKKKMKAYKNIFRNLRQLVLKVSNCICIYILNTLQYNIYIILYYICLHKYKNCLSLYIYSSIIH